GIGGFLGSILRYAITRIPMGGPFPLATLFVNVAGCLVLGLLAGWGGARYGAATRAFLFVGVVGGFTTFSAFGNETFQLLRDGRWHVAALSVLAQVVLGVGGVWAGHALAAR